MPEDDITTEVRDFLSAHINSVMELEALLLMHANSSRYYSADELAKELRIDPGAAAERLAGLHSAGLLRMEGDSPAKYCYAPIAPRTAQTVDALNRAYENRRVTVISLIYSKPVDKLRSFADAFRFRKEKD